MENYKDSLLYRIRHSTAHVMAQAVLEVFPSAKIAIGPAIEDGFYYDFDLPRTLTPEDLVEIEKRMKQIIRGKHSFVRRTLTADEARQIFHDQPFKLELIAGLEAGGSDEDGNPLADAVEFSTYTSDTFVDLCRGPHVESTSQINPEAIKLMTVAGAYWRGDEHNPMLQRIYGTAWQTPKELEEHLWRLEEAKKRDHRKLGRELEIFVFDDEVGPGLPLWLPRGGAMIEELEKLAKEMEFKHGYVRVRTPHLTKEDLFLRSGHLPYYAESMYPPMELDGVKYYIKPMNCPMHHKIYAATPHSYRDLPLRLAEYGTCYRFEKSGELFGLMRVRSMQMNDAHIYCAESQFEQEFTDVIYMYLEYFKLLGISEYIMRFSTHHPRGLGKKYVNNPELWLRTEDLVRRTMDKHHIPYVEISDEAAFYGPKIDVQVKSAIGREFTLATNQVDFAQANSFDLTFMNDSGVEERPLIIHRAPLSTHERLIGFLLEHYAGNFPVWLSPDQVRVIPITDGQNAAAMELAQRLQEQGVRATADLGADRMNAKIRKAQLLKVPYMAVLGEREVQGGMVALRKRDGSRNDALPVAEFVAMVLDRIKTRSTEL
ncbi:MAG TPA: threonine--tRNA ligase [Anaerolineaceae bacterium]|jgi:threonyl-tRNA synthetase|nr:threonine--tRNA ligase [Anaerolineaceae bacterium]